LRKKGRGLNGKETLRDVKTITLSQLMLREKREERQRE